MRFGDPHDLGTDDFPLRDALKCALVKGKHLGVLLFGIRFVVEITADAKGGVFSVFEG